VTDRQTDGIAVASTALAMRALRRAVKSKLTLESGTIPTNGNAKVGIRGWGHAYLE